MQQLRSAELRGSAPAARPRAAFPALPTLLASLAFLASPALAAAAPQGSAPAPGDIAISEILFDPASPVDDNDGEYFEVTNISMHVIDLSGLFVQDLETPGSATAPFFQIPPGALPPLYPGETVVFARSADATLNGGIPKVDYAYAVPTGGTVPPDKSKVSHTGMALNNSAIDAIAITQGAPQNLGGFIIEMVTYDPTKAPLTNHSGVGFERGNLMGPWAVENVAASGATFGTLPQKGTPGSWNTNDTTLYTTWYAYFPVTPGPADGGSLLASGPASAHLGMANLKLSGGPASALYALLISPAPAEVAFLGGTLLVDFSSSIFWAESSQQFDASGKAALAAPISPALVGSQFHLQWISYDGASGAFRFSNGLAVIVVP